MEKRDMRGRNSQGNSPRRGSQTRRNQQSRVQHSNQTGRSNTPRRNVSRKTLQNKKRRMLKRRIKRDLILLGIAVIFITVIVLGVKGVKKLLANQLDIPVKPADVTVNGIKLTGNGIEEDRDLLLGTYTWNLQLQYEDESYTVEDLLAPEIDTILEQVYGEENHEDNFQLTLKNVDTKVGEIVGELETKWNQPAENSEITGFNSENNTFSLSESSTGVIIDSDTLSSDLSSALNSGNYDTVIQVAKEKDEPTATKDDYKVIATYVTHTTNNKLRNINVTLACEAVNGTVLAADEQFSYNGVVGERTEEKGYQLAGAYANGEHVQELGGGVCQLSSTMYNAAVDAGLRVDERVGHSYEPNYVTPGEDATVSFGGPDFKFTNNSGHTLGIRVSFVDRTVTVEIYGVPVLEDGVTQYMESEKTVDTAIPDPTYEEDPSLPFGTVTVSSKGKPGSKWTTNIVKEKDGEVIEDEYLHTTSYKGTGPVIKQNTAGIEGLDEATRAAYGAQIAAQQAQIQADLSAQNAALNQTPTEGTTATDGTTATTGTTAATDGATPTADGTGATDDGATITDGAAAGSTSTDSATDGAATTE